MTKPGYKIDRDSMGLTVMERCAMEWIAEGCTVVETAEHMQVSRQRVYQLLKSADEKMNRNS